VSRPLEGKVALITGGGVRLGGAISRRLAEAGAQVAVHTHRSSQAGEELVKALANEGLKAKLFGADLSRPEAIPTLVKDVEAGLGPVDILVNSAARFDRSPFIETSVTLLEAQWALNVRAPFLLTQAAVRRMVARGGGDVVNVLDIGGVNLTVPRYSAYGMTKAALAQLTETLAVELAPVIRVNAVAPGTVLPPERYSDDAREALRARIPQGRLGSPADVADTVFFLLTGPRFLTGQIVAVDGGRSLAP
jgi:pteridine reductase